MAKNDGGPAFPRPIGEAITLREGDHEWSNSQSGMTLRDWFAGKALINLVNEYTKEVLVPKELALHAYQIADAMIAEREKQ